MCLLQWKPSEAAAWPGGFEGGGQAMEMHACMHARSTAQHSLPQAWHVGRPRWRCLAGAAPLVLAAHLEGRGVHGARGAAAPALRLSWLQPSLLICRCLQLLYCAVAQGAHRHLHVAVDHLQWPRGSEVATAPQVHQHRHALWQDMLARHTRGDCVSQRGAACGVDQCRGLGGSVSLAAHERRGGLQSHILLQGPSGRVHAQVAHQEAVMLDQPPPWWLERRDRQAPAPNFH